VLLSRNLKNLICIRFQNKTKKVSLQTVAIKAMSAIHYSGPISINLNWIRIKCINKKNIIRYANKSWVSKYLQLHLIRPIDMNKWCWKNWHRKYLIKEGENKRIANFKMENNKRKQLYACGQMTTLKGVQCLLLVQMKL